MTTTDWRAIVQHPKHRLAFEALEDPNWDWRTVTAIAKASGLSEEEVARLPDLYPALVRRSVAPKHGGQFVYTLHSEYFARQGAVNKALTFLSGNSSTNTSGRGGMR